MRQIHGFMFGERRKWYLYLAILATALLMAALWARLGMAQSTMVLVSPSSQSIPIDSTTTVDIRIEDVSNLYGAEVHLSFDPGILEVQGIADGDLLTDGFAVEDWDNNAGTLYYAYTLLYPADPVEGSGVLCTITFKGIGGGTSTLLFTVVNLSDPDAQPIPASSQDGSITVAVPTATPTTTPTNTPTSTPTTTATPTSTPTLTTGKILLPLISKHYP
jgi:hypothetical protein